MFIDFCYLLRDHGIAVSPTALLRLHRALRSGLVATLDDFYTCARAILVKSEKHFDTYDRVFAHHFEGAELAGPREDELTDVARALLDEWLRDPGGVAAAFGAKAEELATMSPEELIRYFLDRLSEQTEEHHGGSRWIGSRGTSPVGNAGYHPGGMRIGGVSNNRSAIKTALDRRYRDYAAHGHMTVSQIGEALAHLRDMAPAGPANRVNVEKTVYETMKKAGEIEIVFDRGLADRLKVILAIDNGGWSMDPYVGLVRTLFAYARSQFRELRTFYFHNTIYGHLWEDPQRWNKPFAVDDLGRLDPHTRFIIVGDASMAPSELLAVNGTIHFEHESGIPSIERLRFIRKTFPHSVWINPVLSDAWEYTRTIRYIREVFPMVGLNLDGLEQAVRLLTKNT